MHKKLIELSRTIGMRTDYVQAGGGNISIKLDDEIMLIKASGYNLSDLCKNMGVSTVNYKKIVNYMQCNDNSNEKILKDCHISGEKPSIEIFLHAKMYKYTIHIHSLLSNILSARQNSKESFSELFPEALFVDYAMPGLVLAKKMINYNGEKIVFLKNHGLIVSSDNCEELFELLNYIDKKIASYLNIDYSKYTNITNLYNLMKHYCNDLIYLTEDSNILEAFSINNYKLWNYRFCPDCIVYCGPKELEINNLEHKEFEYHIENYGKITIVIYDKNIYICASSLKKAREIESVLSFSAKIFLNNQNSKLDYLNEEEVKKLCNSDFEKYRQNMK